MPTSGAIDPGKSIAYKHKQSDVEILKDVLPARWLVVGPSGAGKGVVLQNLGAADDLGGGVLVAEVMINSSAYAYGLRSGDIIVGATRITVTDIAELREAATAAG